MNYEIADLPLSEDFYDTIALKTAVWQFILDHFASGVGQFKVHMFVKNEDEFWRRVTARKYGKYTKNDFQVLYKKAQKREDEYRWFKDNQRKINERDLKYGALLKGGFAQKVKYYIIFFLRRYINWIRP